MEQFYWFVAFTAANSLLILLLALHISRLRITKRIAYGDGGDTDMNQAIRAHANGLEHVTLYALVMLALCFTESSQTMLASLVIVFTASRLAHAYGMIGRVFNARRLGAGITYLCEISAICVLIYKLLNNTAY